MDAGRTAVGIDVAEERKGLDLVCLDDQRRVTANAGGLGVAEAARTVLELKPGIVCIDSPPAWAISGKSRECERQLARAGIRAFATGQDPGDHPFYRWMRVGFSVYRSLERDYPRFMGGDPRATSAEVFPHATAVLLGGPYGRKEKTPFRRQVLRNSGVDDGRLPNLDRVDAALAALTGLLALQGHWTAVGDATDGVILLPTVRSI